MLKEFERIKKEILKEFLKADGNIYHAEKLFMAISILKWASEQDGEKETFYKYLAYVEKYLYDELLLYRADGVVRFRNIKKPMRE